MISLVSNKEIRMMKLRKFIKWIKNKVDNFLILMIIVTAVLYSAITRKNLK